MKSADQDVLRIGSLSEGSSQHLDHLLVSSPGLPVVHVGVQTSS